MDVRSDSVDNDRQKLLLRAECHNWGLTKAGDWKRVIYEVYSSGCLDIRALYDMPERCFSSFISNDELSTIKAMISELTASFVDVDIHGF